MPIVWNSPFSTSSDAFAITNTRCCLPVVPCHVPTRLCAFATVGVHRRATVANTCHLMVLFSVWMLLLCDLAKERLTSVPDRHWLLLGLILQKITRLALQDSAYLFERFEPHSFHLS